MLETFRGAVRRLLKKNLQLRLSMQLLLLLLLVVVVVVGGGGGGGGGGVVCLGAFPCCSFFFLKQLHAADFGLDFFLHVHLFPDADIRHLLPGLSMILKDGDGCMSLLCN